MDQQNFNAAFSINVQMQQNERALAGIRISQQPQHVVVPQHNINLELVHPINQQMQQRERSFAELVAISDTITIRGLAKHTQRNYSGHVQAYQLWHTSKQVPTPLLPIDATAVRAWLTDLRLEKPHLQ